MEINKIYTGNIFSLIKQIPDNFINCIITSPPYWGQRNYGAKTIIGGLDNCTHIFDNDCNCVNCGAWYGELGHEKTPDLFVNHLLLLAPEIKRILKPNGVCFINLGDTYNNGKQNKSLCLIPYIFAQKMVYEHNFICRNVINWQKPNQMPQSAKDRFTIDFEPIFFFAKQQDYYFNQQLESYEKPLDRWAGDNLTASGKSDWCEHTGQKAYRNRNMRPNPNGRNMRTTWVINTEPFAEAHFAVYPEKLVERMILSACPENGLVCDLFSGSGTTFVVSRKLNRNCIAFEINERYSKISENRKYKELGMFQ